MLSKKTKYGLKALLRLASQPDAAPLLISDLATGERIPKKFLESILVELKHHGFVQSRKGKGGGYLLGKPADEISFGHVVRVLQGPLALVPCVSVTAYVRCEECADEKTCAVRKVMKEVRDATAAILDSTSLADALAGIDSNPKVMRRKQAIVAAALEPKP